MTSEQVTQVVSMIVAAIVGAIIHRFWPAGLTPPALKPATPATPAAGSHDRPLVDLLTQILAQLLGGGLSVPTPATVPGSTTAAASHNVAAVAVSGSSASLLLTMPDGRHLVLPLDSSAIVQPTTPATPADTSTS